MNSFSSAEFMINVIFFTAVPLLTKRFTHSGVTVKIWSANRQESCSTNSSTNLNKRYFFSDHFSLKSSGVKSWISRITGILLILKNNAEKTRKSGILWICTNPTFSFIPNFTETKKDVIKKTAEKKRYDKIESCGKCFITL